MLRTCASSTCLNVRVHTCVRANAHVHVRGMSTFAHTKASVCLSTHVRAFLGTHVHTHTYTHERTHSRRVRDVRAHAHTPDNMPFEHVVTLDDRRVQGRPQRWEPLNWARILSPTAYHFSLGSITTANWREQRPSYRALRRGVGVVTEDISARKPKALSKPVSSITTPTPRRIEITRPDTAPCTESLTNEEIVPKKENNECRPSLLFLPRCLTNFFGGVGLWPASA